MIMENELRENGEKLAIKPDPLSLNDLDKIKAKPVKKLMAIKVVYGSPRLRMRKGRPYYYLVWYEINVKGIRRQRSIYLGTTLPKGYSLGKRCKIASGQNPYTVRIE